ncbi:P1 family peptidase [Angustibacter sp. McL0619]|uniref:P1 family peptidase n=1 Tax=Angustibacter sp. McL0619 TaxID=3415676 RepID=UPI003CFB44A8
MTAIGPTDSLVDVPGVRVGHCTHHGEGWLTGSTVVLTDPDGAVGGVDVRGGGPGTRETDLLNPLHGNERVHAVLLTGGSAYGLSAADGVMSALEDAGIGYPVGPAGVVPIVPAAVIFDLGRGGDVRARPGPESGRLACTDAWTAAGETAVRQGNLGAGTGALAGGLKGGVGSASQLLDDGTTVAALVVVNAVGSVLDPRTGELWGARHLLVEPPARPEPAALQRHLERVEALRRAMMPPEPLATTLVVIATDATLPKSRCAKVAGIAHDGLARAISPVHTMFDGDTAFALSTARRPEPSRFGLHDLLTAAADCTTRAVVHAVLAAESVETAAGRWPSYREELLGG